jgi:hypothetical protein
VIIERGIRSIALPPLGSGNGRLDWTKVRPRIEAALGSLDDVEIVVFEPTNQYQNVSKRFGVESLRPARALVAELVRRYSILGIECTLLEIQKLAYFLERCIMAQKLPNVLDLRFDAERYGPYAPRLTHLLDHLDGSYLHCGKRLSDAGPADVIWFEDSKKEKIAAYLATGEAKAYRAALEATTEIIDGFESPLGMELLATVDWLINRRGVKPAARDVKAALREWPGGADAGARKRRLFDDRMIELALQRLTQVAGLSDMPRESRDGQNA